MSKHFKKIISFLMAAALAVAIIPADNAEAITVPTDTMKIGLYYGSTALPSANLLNAVGLGYEFGYYDDNRAFVPLAATGEKAITMLVDKNMNYDSQANAYTAGTGTISVGCFHIRLTNAAPDYATANGIAASMADSFVKYLNGEFYVCIGNYLSSADAAAAAAALGITEYTVDSGTSRTVAVVVTGTNKMLFEFDCGSSKSLGVRPVSQGQKTTTYFKGFKYYGGFQYERRGDTGITVVNMVNIEDYVKGVLPYEMSASWPIEALKVQAICARNYAIENLNKHKSDGFDICNTAGCQVYRGTNSASSNSDSAVDQTAGEYLCYNGELCTTYYYSSNGGASENVENVWSTTIPYLRGVEDPYDLYMADRLSNYYWKVTYTGAELAAKLRSYSSSCNFTKVVSVEPKYTDLGNVLSIKFTDVSGKTYTLRKRAACTAIGLSTQRYTVNGGSSAPDFFANNSSGSIGQSLANIFGIGKGGVGALTTGTVYAISGTGTVAEVSQPTAAADKFTFSGSGNGHNVGMSQWGAYSMAKYFKKNYRDILAFYYQGTEVIKIG